MHKLFHLIAAIAAAFTATFAPDGQQATPTGGEPPRQVVVAPPPAPAELVEQLRVLGEGFDGRAGIAIRDIQAGWTATYNGEAILPQQSVSKIWVALAVYEAIDRGQMTLDEPLLMTRDDLSVFHQPIRAKIDADGYQTTPQELLIGAIAKSDNAANDMLMRRVGGGEAVQRVIDDRRLGAIRAGTEERYLQAQIAGMHWRPEYGYNWNFQHARATLPDLYRKERLDAYLADPADGASPAAIVGALAKLKKGRLLTPASTRHMLDVMAQTETGNSRLRAGLAEGWSIAHKTGTGQELAPRVTGWNDVGIVTAPDGRAYAVAVMIAETSAPYSQRTALFQKVARTLVEHHDSRLPAQQQAAAGPKKAA
ncbi:MAG TPA: serine hydrolase [Caulobacteraceae bacterium]|nr:serine hydrolase [Caulobacteraceae bacterium]